VTSSDNASIETPPYSVLRKKTMKLNYASAAMLLMLSVPCHSFADGWAMKTAPLMTKWAADVKPDAPLPDYPRPQLVRSDWLNLNGIWEYQPGAADDVAPVGKKLAGEILVPYPVESAISGVMEHHARIWYRRSFTVPAAWAGKQVILHFGAVDYESEVFVNGKSVGVHKGGYDPFSYDITTALKSDGPQELIVRAFNPVNEGGQPRGKQTLRPPGGIMYTPSTGIWQTVWLEPIAQDGVDNLKIVPDVDGGTVKLTVNLLANSVGDADVAVVVKDGDTEVTRGSGKTGEELSIPVPGAKLWSPDSPNLYDLQFTVSKDGKEIEHVGSYFGMRKISIGEENGVKKMFLNNKFVFEIGPLDQGFWPDGIYTAPTDAAMKNDIEVMKQLGFNMVRKHIKVEPARWYYYTDKLGLLVWQDMPSANSYTGRGDKVPPVDVDEYKSELKRMAENLRNVPSIIMWEMFNEGQGQKAFDTPALVKMTKELDPSRLVNEASGGDYFASGDVHDIHHYPPPECPPANANQALACGEYGGIGLTVAGHTWLPTGGGYTNVQDGKDLESLYGEFANQLKGFVEKKGLSAAVYTQITDVETELNGLMTYDRILKADPAEIAKANHFQYPATTYQDIVPTSETESQTWKFTTTEPAADWSKTEFDDSSWKSAPGGFGTQDTPGIGKLGTNWNTSDIWLRKTIKAPGITAEQIGRLAIRDYHDDDITVFINGVRAYAAKGYVTTYEYRPLSKRAQAAIKPGEDITIAVHCHQNAGGQYIDVGLSERVPAK
jgi:hypothetical protein